MNLTRLMALGLLDGAGPMHGYQLRAIAERTQAEDWAGVSLGSLHRELRSMEAAALVEPVRSESVANRPARTIYAITDLGRQALRELREEAICVPHSGPDRLGAALLFGRIGNPDELRKLLQLRRAALAAQRDDAGAERQRLLAEELITPFDAALFRRQEMRLEAEVAWLDQYGTELDSLPDALGAPGAEPNGQPGTAGQSHEPKE
jgi:DNA-binding PadR family transcriptional regulator